MMSQSISASSTTRFISVLARRSYSNVDDPVRAAVNRAALCPVALNKGSSLYHHHYHLPISLSLSNIRRFAAASSTLDDPDAASMMWSSWDLFIASAVAGFASGATIYFTTSGMGGPTTSSDFGFASWGSGGGSPLPPFQEKAFMIASKRREPEEEDESTVAVDNENGTPFDVSVRAIQGGRMYMEDDYFIGNGGKFVGVFDGHGGADVSRHLRHHLYNRFQQEWKRTSWEMDHSSLHSLVTALRAAFVSIDEEVLRKDAMQYQGSTAVAVAIHEGQDGSRTLVSANVGDSRAVLCRRGRALDMTRDHKPGDERERSRIESMGEQIEWDNYSKVHRVKNLSLSRAIGDRFAKPTVSGEAEIQLFPLREDDEFIILASDGLWDVMTSDQVIHFVKRKMEAVKQSGSLAPAGEGPKIERRMQDVRRKNMSRYVASEALKRGSGDNICVVLVWLKPLDKA